MLNLGYRYRDGDGVAQNIDEAVLWLRRAAAGGEPRTRASALKALADLGR
jgi:TPR repeat protein